VITPFDNSLTPFSAGLAQTGAEPVLVLNMLSTNGRLATNADNPAMITDQVAFLRAAAAAGIAIKRVELGNEFYLDGAVPGANGSDYSTRFPTAASYAQQANPWVSAVRSAFPAAQVAAVGADAAGNNSARREGWNAAVLGTLSGANALTLHPYVRVADATATPQSLLSLANKRMQSLTTTELAQLSSHGMTGWVTEFNMVDRTPALTFAGTWTHGLFTAAFALMLAQSPTITLVDVHNVVGTAVAGVLFDSTEGFGAPTPATQFLGRSAMGAAFAILLQATAVSTTGQKLSFAGGPTLPAGGPGLVGVDFTGGGQHQAVVVNLSNATAALDIAGLFPGSFSWARTRAAALTTKITGPGSLTVTTGTATGSLNLPSHTVARLFT
jgi:hypothetical protein